MQFRPLPVSIAVMVVSLFVLACTSDSAPTPTPTSPAAVASPTTTAATTATALPTLPVPELAWESCGTAQCAELTVPMDYNDPTGRSIDIAMIKLQAREPDQRIGSLLLNFGGPGASGLEYLPLWSLVLPAEIRDRFDIVSFDPRGVGESQPIRCNDNIREMMSQDPSPESQEDWEEVEQVSRQFAELCAERAGEFLRHVGTLNVARDLDQMRAALGDEKLTYLGYSYGTSIGSIYAELFPTHIRAMVLDGAVDVALSTQDLAIQQALGFEGAFENYLEHCAATGCLDGYGSNPRAGIEALLQQLEETPVPAPGADRSAGAGEAMNAMLGAMYTESYWSTLNRAINNAFAGDGTGLIRLADSMWQRNPDGSYPNLFEMLYAVNCIDDVQNRDLQHYRDLADRLSDISPIFGRSMAMELQICAFWQAEATPLPAPVASGAPPILVIGTTRDPATPYQWAVNVAERMTSAVLLTYQGLGHTAYLAGGEPCIDEAVNAYFLELIVPEDGLTCGDPAYATPIDVTR